MEIILIGQQTTDKERSKMENYIKRVRKTIESIEFEELQVFLKLFPKYREINFKESNQRESFKIEGKDIKYVSKLEWFRGKFIDLLCVLLTHNMYSEMIDITKDIRSFEMKRREIRVYNDNFSVYDEVKADKKEHHYYGKCDICGEKQVYKNETEIYQHKEWEGKCKKCLNYFKIKYIPVLEDTYQFKILKILEKHEHVELVFISEYEDMRPYFKVKIKTNTFIIDDLGICDIFLDKPIDLKELETLIKITKDFYSIIERKENYEKN